MPKNIYNLLFLLDNSGAHARRQRQFMYKNTTIQEAQQSTANLNLYEYIDKCPVPDRYHKLSCR
jgi:hypothetical protein